MEEDRYYLPDPFEKDGTYERSDVVLLGQVFPPPHASFNTESFCMSWQNQALPRRGPRRSPQDPGLGTKPPSFLNPFHPSFTHSLPKLGHHLALDSSISSQFAWLQLTPNVNYNHSIQAGNGPPSHDSDSDYDGQSDTDDYSVQYTTWTGLEFTSWATHSYIDSDGRMDLYSLRQLREADLYTHGALPRCDWWHWEDPDQHPGSEGPDLVLVTPEGDEFELDDPKEYDGSYAEETNQVSQSCDETDDDADGGSETGYAFDAAKGIMWADDEAEDDYWERVEGQGEEW